MKKKSNDSWDDIQVFTKKGARIADPKISISPNNTISFNAAFCHRAGLDNKTHIVLLYSKKNKAIIFDFTTDAKAKGAFRLVSTGGSAFTTCRSFFHAHDLQNEYVGHYTPRKKKLPKIGEAWFIKLDEKIKK